MSTADSHDSREELAAIAASLRAYLEWQESTGATGIPRKPQSIATTKSKREVEAAPRSRGGFETRPYGVPAPEPPASLPAMARQSESRSLPVIAEEVRTCQKCGLSAARTNTVFSRGSPTANLCFVGEAPGADEDAQGVPFVGRAGQLLDRMIVAMGLDPTSDVYICNIIKCRPPGNRRPEPDEMNACIPYLHEQLAIVDPKVIVALGNTAVGVLLGTTLGITKVRGQWKLYRGKIPMMPTYHPSYLLRPGAQQATARKHVWNDLQAVMRELGLKRS